jgi:hypothetical protein
MLTPGFVVGDPKSQNGFYFLADLVLPGESTPRISTRVVEKQRGLILELIWNRIVENPGRCIHQPISGGFQIRYPTGESIVEVHTQTFANGYLTRIKARLFDEAGNLRVEPLGKSIQIHGEVTLALESPFTSSR